jgi:hypothetical protein
MKIETRSLLTRASSQPAIASLAATWLVYVPEEAVGNVLLQGCFGWKGSAECNVERTLEAGAKVREITQRRQYYFHDVLRLPSATNGLDRRGKSRCLLTSGKPQF